ncbi:MAG: Ig-like domain-containing protein [Spirochaetia bacterium]|nr:Ig-like domain-containing protein [Spirochaetia bacterium]
MKSKKTNIIKNLKNNLENLIFGLQLLLFLMPNSSLIAQVLSGTDKNLSKISGDVNNCSIAVNPTNKMNLYAVCDHSGPGLIAVYSTDRGSTWKFVDDPDTGGDKVIADGNTTQGAGIVAANGSPDVAWDIFGNIYIVYAGNPGGGEESLELILSTDNGFNFANVKSYTAGVGGLVTKPAITVDTVRTSEAAIPAPYNRSEQLWVSWTQHAAGVTMQAVGFNIIAAGATDADKETVAALNDCDYGDISISPQGNVSIACQVITLSADPNSQIKVITSSDTVPDGLSNNWANPAENVALTNVSTSDKIDAAGSKGVNAGVSIAYDRASSFGGTESLAFERLYLVYTDEPTNEASPTVTNIKLWYKDWGSTWVEYDDGLALFTSKIINKADKSAFLPSLDSNPKSGNISICWYDTRNDTASPFATAQFYCAMLTRPYIAGNKPEFIVDSADGVSLNRLISNGASTAPGLGNDFGQYTGIQYFQGAVHPVWADYSNSTGDNPNGTSKSEGYTDYLILGGAAANEGDPHLRTVNGIRYDFQPDGEFVALRGDGIELQLRHTAISPSNSYTIYNSYTDLRTCVDLNTGLATKVGKNRVTYQPGLDGKSPFEVRIDGKVTTITSAGQELDGGYIKEVTRYRSYWKGIEIDYPNGAKVVAFAYKWYGQPYLNITVSNASSSMGTMGFIKKGDWLPLLPDGASLGKKPSTEEERYYTMYEKFADPWRVVKSRSLFDYSPGQSTAHFTNFNWPPYPGSACVIEKPSLEETEAKLAVLEEAVKSTVGTTSSTTTKKKPKRLLKKGKGKAEKADQKALTKAKKACKDIKDKDDKQNCIEDVTLTNDEIFAQGYKDNYELKNGLTKTIIRSKKGASKKNEKITLIASVKPVFAKSRKNKLTGKIQFMINGKNVGKPVSLDKKGNAVLAISKLKTGKHKIFATFIPGTKDFLTSTSHEIIHKVK